MTAVPAALAAAQLGITRRRVSDLWRAGELRGRKYSSGLLIELDSVHEREAVGAVDGRPWLEDAVWNVILALSGESGSASHTVRQRIDSNDGLALGQRIASAVTTTRFEARRPDLVREALTPTGESATDRLQETSGERLLGAADLIRGYPRMPLDVLVAEYDLIESTSGPIVVHTFRSGTVRVRDVTPLALAAADCFRSTRTRVRRVGLDTLDGMREAWLTADT
jgi:hypothetical protein